MASSVTLSENLFLVSLAVGPSGRKEFELFPGDNVVGCKKGAAIYLPHRRAVSKEHCIIVSKDGVLALFDLDSRYGTFVNGHKVTPRSSISLFVNDTVGFGVTSATAETYVDAKTPFHVYRVTKKIPNEVFERIELERELAHYLKRRADFSSDVPAMKRTKSDAAVPSVALPLPATLQIQPSPKEITVNCESDSRRNANSMPSRPSNTSESKQTCGTESSSSAGETSGVQNSFLVEDVDDDEIPELHSLDEDSYFDQPSQSSVLPEEEMEERKKKPTKSDKPTKTKEVCPEKRSIKKEAPSKTSKQATIKTATPDEKKSISDKKPPTSNRETSKSEKDGEVMKKKAKTRSQLREADGASKLPVSTVEERKSADRDQSHDVDFRVMPVRISRCVSESSKDKVKERRISTEFKLDKNKTSNSKNKAENEIPKKTDMGKKAILIEPQVLSSNNKENRMLKSAGSVKAPQVVIGVAAPPREKAKVTFKEQNMVEVIEFECLGNMKLPSVSSHLPKEHPPKIPSLQWNGHLLRCCPQVSDICQWSLKWLQESQWMYSDPPLIDYQPAPIENRYKKFDDYYFTMLSLVMHELWSDLYEIHKVQTKTERFNLFSGVIEHIEPNFDKRSLFSRCKIVTSGNEVPYLPNFGDIVGVQIIAPNKERTRLYDSFGVVTRQYSWERLKPSRETNFLLSSLPTNRLDTDKMVGCPIEVIFQASKTQSNVSKDCFVQLRVYKNIINQLNCFRALQKVDTSPLKAVILDPTTCAKGTPDDKRDIELPSEQFQFPLNQLQKEAVIGVTNSVIYEDSSISLIHGPPGTGKSTTITSIILHLLPILRNMCGKGPPPKILLCAPSNKAIDELCLKLVDIKKKLPDMDKFKLTRVGNEKKMHRLVHEVSSSASARSGLMITDPVILETEIRLLRASIQVIKNGPIYSKAKAKPNEQQKYNDLIEKLETRLAFFSKTSVFDVANKPVRNCLQPHLGQWDSPKCGCLRYVASWLARSNKPNESFIFILILFVEANIKSGRPPLNPDENRKLLNQEECTIITGAEIIATTLSSSSSRKMFDGLSDSTQFSCCIVDEATQATEPEVLIPLLHDIRHLVLVGDPQQLGATVVSKFAKERNFEWSLYHRLMDEWKDNKVTPLYPLREQYRTQKSSRTLPSKKPVTPPINKTIGTMYR